MISVLVGRQVLGRTGALPLILLPQFGGYWIEGTNHDLGSSSAPEEPPPCPSSQCTLETNSIAKIYRKDFLGKVKLRFQDEIFCCRLSSQAFFSLFKSQSMNIVYVFPQEHFNYYSVDSVLGHLVFSVKYDVIGDQEHLRLLLRYRFSHKHKTFHLCLLIKICWRNCSRQKLVHDNVCGWQSSDNFILNEFDGKCLW